MNLDKYIEKLSRCELLSEKQVKYICYELKEKLLSAPNVCTIHTPVTVVGDIHG